MHDYLNKEERSNLGKLIPELEDEANGLEAMSINGLLIDLSVHRIKAEIDAEIDANYALDAEEVEEEKLQFLHQPIIPPLNDTPFQEYPAEQYR